MNLNRIKKLTLEIKRLEKELEIEKKAILEEFRLMSSEDIALIENKMKGNGITITYYPKSITTTVDTAKLKADGLYEKYSKTITKSDYIKIHIKEDE